MIWQSRVLLSVTYCIIPNTLLTIPQNENSQPSYVGDLNGDGEIDVGDVQTVSGRVDQSVGDPNFVLEYDVNNDGLIDEEDVSMITDRLYETCP